MRTVYKRGDYEVVKTKYDFVVRNNKGEYCNHSHFSNKELAITLTRVAYKKKLPKTKSKYLVDSLLRIVVDNEYRERLENYKRGCK